MATDPPQLPETAEESEEQSSRVQLWRVVLAVLVLGGVVEVIIYGYLERPGWIGSFGKQFWDYLDLLIVPSALALGVYWLNRRQTERDQQAEDAQQERALAVESQRAQDEALQAYLDQMSQLLLDKDRSLRQAKEGDEVRTLARVRTLTVLPRLDAYRKRTVMRFLYEADLIHKDRHIIDLAGANLSEAYLRGVNLRNANLFRANLSKANLIGASLSDAKLYRANLSSAALIGAHLIRTDLEQVNLRGADLSGAHLTGANLTKSLVTSEQLEKCKSLKDAIMPDGQQYEDWLKSKGRGEDGETSGTS